MNTDHTNGSPLDAGPESAVDPHFATPVFADSSGSVKTSAPEVDASSDVRSESRSEIEGSDAEGQHTDAIEFRVIRPGAPIRRLRLTGNRYTFGSAEGCSIRLSDHALRPMHAVLIRDASRILVRAYSVPIQVNGTRMTEATLQTGDVLRLGAYQFELLSSTRGPSASPLGPRFATGPRSVFDSPPADPARAFGRGARSGATSFGGARGELPSSEDVIWRERLRREIDQWRERQSECDRREDRCDERESDLRNRETELWSRAENLYRRESRLQSQEAAAFQLYDEFAQRQEELIRLREETQSRQEQFRQRENEFRNEEFEYRRRLEEATRQLHQSQQQADSATEAVSRMREQFESLNQQIEVLSSQQGDIEQRERQQREEHERLRLELEKSRDEAIDAQAESEARRQEALARVEEMSAQIEALKAGQGVDDQHQQAALEESQRLAEELRQQVEDLQKSVAEAGEESSRLRRDYEEACKSVRQLESLVEQSSQRGEQDRESWAAEADELRTAMEQLSTELANANSELSQLRDANTDLSARLDAMQHERDEAQQELTARPTSEAFESLRSELDQANEKLDQMKRDYDDVLVDLDANESRSDAPIDGAAATPAPDAPIDRSDTEMGGDVGETESEQISGLATEESDVDGSDQVVEGESAWPSADGSNDHLGDPSEAGDAAAENLEQDESDFTANVEQTAAWDGAQVETGDDGESAGFAETSADSAVTSHWDSTADIPPIDDPSAENDSSSETGFWSDDSSRDPEASTDSVWANDSDSQSESDAVWGDASSKESDEPWPDESGSHESHSQGWDSPQSSYETTEQFGDGELPPGIGGFAGHGGSDTEDTYKNTDEVYQNTEGTDDVVAEYDAASADSLGEGADEVAGENTSLEASDSLEAQPDHRFGDTNHGQAEEGEPLAGEPAADDSVVEGSLASMLIQDLESESAEADEAAPPEGTFVMDEVPQTPGWDDQQPVSWDQEHTEESYTSQWSNNPEGYREEQVGESSPYDSTDELSGAQEQSYAAPQDGDVAGGYEPHSDDPDQYQPEGYQGGDQEQGEYDSESIQTGSYESSESQSDHYESSEYESGDHKPGEYESAAYESAEYESAEYESESDDSSASYHQEVEQEQAPVDPPVPEPAPDDDSIEAYMNRLLQRCHGDSAEEGAVTESVSVSTTSQPSVLASAETEVHAESYEEAEEEKVDPDAPLVPRSRAPERNSDLSAMRELANESARSAINRSVRLQTRDTQIRGATNAACGVGALVCGIACYFFIPGNIRWLAVAMTVIVALISFKEAFSMFVQARERLQAAEDGNAASMDEKPQSADSEDESNAVAENA